MPKTFARSFAGGEITPEMFGRLDLDKFQTGVADAENFVVLPHGPAANRPGFEYVLQAGDESRRVKLIPFAWSAEQTIMLEFGHLYVRFHTAGGTLLHTVKNISAVTQASPGVLTSVAHGYSTGDWVFALGFGGMTTLNFRFYVVTKLTNDTFSLSDLFGNAISTAALPAYTGGGTTSRVVQVTTPYTEDELFDLHYTQSADVLTLVHPSHAVQELRRISATSWTLTAASFAPAIAAPTGPAATPTGAGAIQYDYKVTAIASSNFEESVASANANCANDITVAGQFNTITWVASAGATRYNVYKKRNGLYGYIGQTSALTFDDDNITQDLSKTPPEANNPFAAANDYPSAVTYVEQRRCFAATNNRPQHIWMTRSATEGNMTQSIPLQDDDAIIFRIAANEQNRIRHLVPLGDLIPLTVGSEFRVYSDGGGPLTPSTVAPKQQSKVGAGAATPVVAGNAILYAQAQGGHVQEFVYAGDGVNGKLYNSNDISILAPHLFDDYTIADMAYSRTSKCPTLWVVRSDGVLLGMTYVPGQNVRAWHHHITDGIFESVACVAEGSEDALYAVVKRTINGATKRYVERLHSRVFSTVADAFFVDSGSTYEGSPATAITGLWHLEGETVVGLADGAVISGTVAGGGLTLGQAASKVHLGLPYTCDLQTLPVTLEAAAAFGQGAMKNVSKVHMRVSRSSGMKAGPDADKLVEVKHRTTEPYGSPPELRTGYYHVATKPEWVDDASVLIRQDKPLPLMVVSLVLEVVSGG